FQALIDDKKVVVTEAIIRRDLHLDDADGVECLPNAEIFEELARMGYEKPPPKLTFNKAFFIAFMASAVICLATGRKFNFSKYIFDSMARNVDNPSKFLIGNPNSTASTFNPSAEKMETLTVESPITTASSPVPTACLNDSSKTSSEARLVSKRVAHQEESPSLKNILSLTNRFDDILGVSISSDETIGVEADISNMETSISASPTPTLRIHKDHPKKPNRVSDALQDPS
nr:hypothetical protein [Tanacetum cinerariifolium]